jgi:hypothetical protein
LPNLDTEIGADTATVGDKTGLARVLVEMDSYALADDIAEVVLDVVRDHWPPELGDRVYSIRVVSDPAFLRDVDVYRIIEARLKNLRTRLTAFPPPPKNRHTPKAIVGALGAAGLVTAGIQAFGLATKLFARSYQVTGEEVAVDDLGFDLSMAHQLRANRAEDERLRVEVDRLSPTADSAIAKDLWQLALDADQALAPQVAERAGGLAEARARATSNEDAIKALDSLLLELVKKIPEQAGPAAKGAEGGRDAASLWTQLRNERAQLFEQLPALKQAVATARKPYEEATALMQEIEDFLTYAITVPAGGRAPIAQAARVEGLASSDPKHRDRFTLYCRLIAGGVDRTIETKLGPDKWMTLAGASAEFALLSSEGKTLRTGVLSRLESSSINLDNPDSFRQKRPGYERRDRRAATA